VLNYKCFFTLVKRDRVSTVNIKKIYILKCRIVLFSPVSSIVYFINTVKKRKEVEFLLNCFGTYNHESFI
jgi:hypothetical protein